MAVSLRCYISDVGICLGVVGSIPVSDIRDLQSVFIYIFRPLDRTILSLAYPKGAFLSVPPGRPLLTLCPPVSE
ncbi:hypothetical protein J6590_097298 [Homalodisca vitripennis]|nr:hypothetical protein J6590_097298 [Homalodisca vitripennis]